MTVYRRPDPIPLRHARPVHGPGRASAPASPGESRPQAANLSERVARELALGLMAGRFLQDGVLWTEPQLCAGFGISRTALREAIKILSAKGMVETRRKRGTILRHRSEWNLLDPDVIRWLFVAEPERTTAALAEAMGVLARAVSHPVATPRSDADLAALLADVERIRRAGNPFLSAFAETTLGTLRGALSDGAAAAPARA